MKKVLACVLSTIIIVLSCGVLSLAADNNAMPIPYTLSDSIDFDITEKTLPVLSGELPKYYYLFDNGKPVYTAYSLLDDCQKKMYDYIVNASKDSLTISMTFDYGEFLYSNFVKEYLWEVMYAICNDRPDVFYYNGYSIENGLMYDNTCIKSLEYTVSLMSSSTYTADNISDCYNDMITAMNAVEIDTSNRYNFVKSIHDYLCETVYYPELNSSDYIGNAHDAYGALVEKRAVCQGYADAFKLICDSYKIPCVCLTGTANGGAHMWNAVQMDDGLWYLVDATWDDQTDTLGIMNDFFLVGLNTVDTYFGSTAFSESHVADTDIFLPTLKYASEKYAQTNHFTEFGATYNSIAKSENKYLIRSYFDVYDSYIYYNGMYVEVATPATNSVFFVNSGDEGATEDWTLVSICDCNGDALANADDYSIAVNNLLSEKAVETVYDMAADADCDGYIDVMDVAIIQRAISGMNTDIVLE